MRHKKNQSKLGRPTDQRLALIRGQVSKLFLHGYINTTLPRARAVQAVAEKLVTSAKRGTLADIRICAKQISDKKALQSLIKNVAPSLKDRQSGYSKIAKLKYRRGDGALVVRLSLAGASPTKATG